MQVMCMALEFENGAVRYETDATNNFFVGTIYC